MDEWALPLMTERCMVSSLLPLDVWVGDRFEDAAIVAYPVEWLDHGMVRAVLIGGEGLDIVEMSMNIQATVSPRVNVEETFGREWS